jgi:hypothetical protein
MSREEIYMVKQYDWNKFVEVLIIFIIFLLILIMNIVAMGEIPEEKRGSVIEGVLIGNISFFLGTVLLCGVAIIGTNFDVWKEIMIRKKAKK